MDNGKKIGLALSGGGFRATLFHIGMVRALSDAGELANVKRITSVSGGSIFAAHLVLHWEEYLKGGENFDKALKPLLNLFSYDVRGRLVRRLPWTMLRGRTLTDRLERMLRKKLFPRDVLNDLAKPGRPELYILATNARRGARAHFTHRWISLGSATPEVPLGQEERLAEGVQEALKTASPREALAALGSRYLLASEREPACVRADTCLVSLAVAASAAFPGLFRPLKLTREKIAANVGELPSPEFLSDGGVWDNLGLRCLMERNAKDPMTLNVVSNARAHFDWDECKSFSLLRNLLRSSDIMMERIRELEKEFSILLDAVDSRLKIVDIMAESGENDGNISPAAQRTLCKIRTDFDRFSSLEIDALVRHGYCVTRQVLSLPLEKAPWTPRPNDAKRNHGCGDDRELLELLKSSSIRRLRLVDARDWLSWIALSVALIIVGCPLYGLFAYFFPAHCPAIVEEALSSFVAIFETRPKIVGIWNATIEWNEYWKPRLVTDAKFSLEQLKSQGVVCFERLNDGQIIGTSHWELSTWEVSLAVLSVEMGDFRFDQHGRLQEMRLISSKRGKVVGSDGNVPSFTYGGFREYVMTFDKMNSTTMEGKMMHIVEGTTEREEVGKVHLAKRILP